MRYNVNDSFPLFPSLRAQVDACPVKDKKVLGYIEKNDLKTLGKYLEKNAGGGGKKGKRK